MSAEKVGAPKGFLEAGRQDFVVEALAKLIDPRWIGEVLAETGKRSLRRRRLPASLTMWLVVLLGLFRRTSYQDLLEKLAGSWGLADSWGDRPPGSSAVTKARDRIGVEPLKKLFERSSAIWVNGTRGLIAYGRRVMALDGGNYKVADTDANRQFFGLPGSWRGRAGYPQARSVELLDVGTRLVRDVEYGPYQTAEIKLAWALLARLPIGVLLLLDRNFFAFAFLYHLTQRSSDFIVRCKRSTKPQFLQRLGKGDELVQIRPGRALRKQHPELPAELILRRVTCVVRRKGCRYSFQVLTSVVDPTALSADDIVRLYFARWDAETSNGEFKTTLCDCATVNRPVPFRSRTPERVQQEYYGALIAYNAVRKLMCDATVSVGRTPASPLRVSFTAALARVREAVYHMGRLPTRRLLARYRQLLAAIAAAKIPDRPNRSAPRAVKIKISKYPVKATQHAA